jgi:hypothetical protein
VKKFLVLAIAAVLAIAPLASANTFSDPDDMTSPLDVRRLVHRDKGGDVHSLKVVTDQNWRCRYLDPKLNKIRLLFDGGKNPDIDLVGNLRCLKFEGQRELILVLSGRDTASHYEPVPVTRPSRHSFKATFSFDLPELQGTHVDMLIRVKDSVAEGCTSAFPCTERAPDASRWRLY